MAPSANTHVPTHVPIKQKMAVSFRSLMSSVLGKPDDGGPTPMLSLFTKTDPAKDGDDCLHDCEGCSVKYPRGFKIEESDVLYGNVKEWSTHVLIATGKTDWVRDSADEKGSVMEALDHVHKPTNGKMKVSASNMCTPNETTDYSEPTTVLLLPAFTLVRNVQPANAAQFVSEIVSVAPTNTSPVANFTLPASLPSTVPGLPDIITENCPHKVIVLLCSQKTRDARCGQSAPLLRKEIQRHLRPLGLDRDLQDHRPGGVGIYFIDHVGGHKYSANVMIYRRPNAFGQDDPVEVAAPAEENEKAAATNGNSTNGNGTNGHHSEKTDSGEVGATQCIWLARVKPEDCENLVRYTILKGKVVKPESQLRGGFDRCKGLMSW